MVDYELYVQKLKEDRVVCLKGIYWDRAFTIITNSKKRDNSILPNPLILSGWHCSDDDEKENRFYTSLTFAYNQSRWEELILYLDKLPESAWHKK